MSSYHVPRTPPVTKQAQVLNSHSTHWWCWYPPCAINDELELQRRKSRERSAHSQKGQQWLSNLGLCGSRTCSTMLDLLAEATGPHWVCAWGPPRFMSGSVLKELHPSAEEAPLWPCPARLPQYLCPVPPSASPTGSSPGTDRKGSLAHLQTLLSGRAWPITGLWVPVSLEWGDNHSPQEGFGRTEWRQCMSGAVIQQGAPQGWLRPVHHPRPAPPP